MFRPRFQLATAALSLGLTALAGAADLTITAESQSQATAATPFEVAVPNSIKPGAYSLLAADGTTAVPASVFEIDGKRHLAAVLPAVAGNASRTYRLAPDTKSANPSAISIRPNDAGGLDVDLDGKPFTRLVLGPTKPFFHPLIGPTGDPFTRAYPMENIEGERHDHPHQRSFWITHGNVNGHDYWGSDPLNKPNPHYGQIKQTGAQVLVANGAIGVIRTTNDWLAPDGSIDCRDTRTVRFWGSANPRILDVDLTLTAGDKPATFGDTKEGMFGLRVPTSMDVDAKNGGKITSAEGLHDADAWGKPSPWVDYNGPVAGKTVGIAILNHPSSFRYPTHWHVRTYGLFAANPFGYTDFKAGKPGAYTLEPGESIHFAYRIILHEGDTTTAAIDRAFAAYASQARITVSAAD